MKVLVKVGKESDLKIRGAELKRAITINEVKKALEKEEYDKVIFEEIDIKTIAKIEALEYNKSTFIIYNRSVINEVEDKARQLGVEVYHTAEEVEQYIENLAGNIASGLNIKSTNEILSETNKLEKELGVGKKSEPQEEDIFNTFETEPEIGKDKNKNIEIDDNEKSVGNKTEFIRASATIEYLEAQLDEALNANSNLMSIKNMLEKKIDDYKSKLESIMANDDISEYSYVEQSEKELLEQIENLKKELEVASELKIELEMLRKSNKDIDLIRIENKKEIEKLEDKVEYEVEARIAISKALRNVARKLFAVKNELETRKKEIGSFLKNISELESRIREKDKELAEQKRNSEEAERILTEQVYMLSGQVEDLMQDLEESSCSLMLHEEVVKEKDSTISMLESKIAELEDVVDSTRLAMNEQNNEISRFRSMDIEEMQENIEALQESNGTLASEIGRYRRERDELKRQLESAEKKITEASKQIDALGITARSLSRSTDASETIRIKCDYTGKGFILPVFGSGSYGTTAVTVALANALKGKVLVVDFDVINPKLDGWYSLSPIIRELPEMSNELKKTGFGSLIEKGLSYILDNEKLIIRNVEGKDGSKDRVDYMSGAYTKIDMYKLMAVNFSEFFNYYGNEYDYIVVDCGRLGGSEMANAIIRMLNDIAFKNIIVGLGNDTDSRTVALRMRAENIDGAKTIWVLNMMRRKILGEVMKKSVAYAADYMTIPFYPDIYGENIELDKYKDTWGYIDKLVNLVLK